jgi:hypothetical protein
MIDSQQFSRFVSREPAPAIDHALPYFGRYRRHDFWISQSTKLWSNRNAGKQTLSPDLELVHAIEVRDRVLQYFHRVFLQTDTILLRYWLVYFVS